MVFAVLLGEKVMVMVMYMHKRAQKGPVVQQTCQREQSARVSVCLCVCVCVSVCVRASVCCEQYKDGNGKSA